MDHIAIIVLNWRQPQITINTIDSLLKIHHPHFAYKIFLIDNHSQDGSVSRFKSKYGHHKLVKIFRAKSNYGYVGGNNIGIKKAIKSPKYKYILIINNDVLVDPDFLTRLLVKIKSDKSIGIVGPKIYFAPGYEFHRHRYTQKDIGKVIWSVGGKIDWDNILGSNLGVDEVDRGQYDDQPPTPDFVSGCCFLVRRKLFQKIGLFDHRFYMYLEDSDFSQRAVRAGYRLVIEPQAKIWHLSSASSAIGSDLASYFITRNRLLFGLKYGSLRAKLALFRESIKFLFFGSQWQRTAVIDFYLLNFGQGSWSQN